MNYTTTAPRKGRTIHRAGTLTLRQHDGFVLVWMDGFTLEDGTTIAPSPIDSDATTRSELDALWKEINA